ncbi:unnamed protein product [Clonostachys rosea f. rosea IK726]|uniref:Uncharacterized protein n=1 Tax=Clonostachys rosea f. rosea IK726 TaxID=1349383 RepID=A0ACA9U1M6_BIOOC|nr:unnamed protein product [Clonostachys rosea f. rosea IK726]
MAGNQVSKYTPELATVGDGKAGDFVRLFPNGVFPMSELRLATMILLHMKVTMLVNMDRGKM